MSRRLVAIMAFASAVASGALASADSDGPPVARAGLTASLPDVDVDRFPFDAPFPLPHPAFETAHLTMVRLDGTPLIDVQPFDAHGDPIPEAFARIEEAFASRSGATTPVHPRLVELLMTISAAFGDQPLKLVSAHREAGRGTRKTSYHVRGMAADISIQGVSVHDLRDAAVRLGAWGVGVYPSFVHVDARKDQPYEWVGSTYARWRYVRARNRAMRNKSRALAKARMARARRRR